MPKKTFDFGEVLGAGWQTTRANLKFFVIAGLLYSISLLPVIAQPLAGLLIFLDVSRTSIYTMASFLKIIEQILEIIFSIGLIKIALAFCDGQKPNISTLFKFGDCLWRYAATFILYHLIVTIGILLFIIPGFYWLTKFNLCFYFVVDKGLGPIEALKASSRTTMGVKWQLFGFIIICGFIALAGLLCLGIGLLFAYPVILVANALVYRQLAAQTPELADICKNTANVSQYESTHRPLAEIIFIKSLQASGILFLCFVFYCIWFFSGKPLITDKYIDEINRMSPIAADQSLNAAPLYSEAIELYKKSIQDNNDVKELLSKKFDKASPEQKNAVERWLTDNKGILDLLITGSNKPHYWQNYKRENEQLFAESSIKDLRILTYSLRCRARLNAENGKFKEAFDDTKASYHIGKHIKNNSVTYTEQLVGIAIESVAVGTVRYIVSHYQIDSATFADLQNYFADTITNDFALDFKKDKLVFYDQIQRCFTHDYFGKGHLYPKGYEELSSESNAHFFNKLPSFLVYTFSLIHPTKEQTTGAVDNFYNFLEEIASKSPAQIRAEGIDIKEQGKKITQGNLLLNRFMPPVNKIIDISYRAKFEEESVLPLIAIIRYKQDTGEFPENLEKLIETGYLKKVPIDPFSDKPIGYKKTKDNFVLYGAGFNCIDDGGVPERDKDGKVIYWSDNGDWIFWPVEK